MTMRHAEDHARIGRGQTRVGTHLADWHAGEELALAAIAASHDLHAAADERISHDLAGIHDLAHRRWRYPPIR